MPLHPPYRSGPAPDPAHVVVVGGGISGLAAGAAVRRERPDVTVTVLEGSPTIGGKLALAEVGGITVDVGAEAMLNRRPEAVALAEASGLRDRIVHPRTTNAALWSRGRMVPMPRTMMGVPLDTRLLAESGVISKAGLARAALDAVLPATHIDDRDVSIGWLVEERFGKEVVDRLVEPLLGGVYAGHAREISARAAVPQVVALLDRDRSLMRAAAAATGERPADDVPVFAGLVGGVGQLPAAVAGAAGLVVRTGAVVRDLARAGEGGWNLVVGSTHDPEIVHADAVVLATPAHATGRLLADVVPDAALELARVETASMAVITLAFREREVPDALRSGDTSGFLVPPVDRHQVKAATYSFSKWAWVREAGRGDGEGNDVLVLRCSIGRHREEQVLQVDDAELVQTALEELADAVGLCVRPVDSHVQRWGGGLPQYAVGHLERVRHIREAVARVPGLAVCGATYDGLGIPACISSAEKAATQVLAALPARGE
ncbi:protoporphyrinogen oxidase [Nocardioides mesophilus]|uniref:Coproporphyrinogen III oxidase n=1 Tax=Nocardioides mesophilus TaxID=433659 RepID=A0A7G9RA16_9ACTN|nr:protoporphyrinogen oxidase [Nocardioides mesophilus]QNN52441.1 protoporphyrinogen oxidase [Nocardioides mesophilus]